MKKVNLILLVICCESNEIKGIQANEIDIETLKKVNRLPNVDPKADFSQTNDFKNAFNNHQEQFEFTSLLMTSRRWVLKKDINGRPISRERIAAITAALNDKCYIQHFIFKQDADGSDYSETYISEAYGWKVINCELLN